MEHTRFPRMTMALAATALLLSAAAFARPCNVPSTVYPTIQSAVNDSTCAAINVAVGTYTEQVTISRSLTMNGVDSKTVIKAPSVLAPDAGGYSNVVEINNGASVHASHITVAGPGPGGCGTITSGIAIIGGALLDIDHSAVLDIRDNPLSGCQNGDGIRAGTQPGGAADVGTLIADHVLVTGYQKDGIVVAGSGSTGQIHENTVQSLPTAMIASNGIEIAGSATATVDHNTVNGNQCNLAGVCGPDWFSQTQSSGILLIGAGTGTTVSNNRVNANDIGIYADSGGDIMHNDFSGNRDFGLLLDSGYAATVGYNNASNNTEDGVTFSCSGTSCDGILVFASGATFQNNNASKNGNNGIEVGPVTPSSVGNTFSRNVMMGNGVVDANDHTTGVGTAGTGNTWTNNNCKTSTPSGLCK